MITMRGSEAISSVWVANWCSSRDRGLEQPSKRACKTVGGSQAEGSPFREGKTQLGEILVAPIDCRDNCAAVTLGLAFSVIDTCLDDQTHGVLGS